MHILVVEDEPSILSTYNLLLTEEGYEVSTCSTYKCGHQKLKERNYDAALIDISLEREDLGLVRGAGTPAHRLRHADGS